MSEKRTETPFSFYRFGRSSYSVVERASGLEVCVVRGKREARAVRDALRAAGATTFDEATAAVRAAVEELGLRTVRELREEVRR
jgi:hypothetical protein